MNRSAWRPGHLPRYKKLSKSRWVDAVVIGGGITGLSAAYFLKMAGKTVAVVERGRLGSGDTGATTAHVTAVTDVRLSELAKNFGKEQARLVWDAGAWAIDAIEAIADGEEIDCGFQRIPGFLHAPLQEGQSDQVEQFRQEARLGAQLGLPVEFVFSVPLVHKCGLRFADQAKFDPLAYLGGLARAAHGDGCEIFEKTEADEVRDEPLSVRCGRYALTCDHVIVATHVPLMGQTNLVRATLLQSKLFPYSTYAIGATVPRGSLPELSLWDTSDPYYYLRVDRRPRGDYVIFGGEDHKTGQAAGTSVRFKRLESVLHDLLPAAKVDRHWSGQVIETNDGLPYIGPSAERQFVATGFAGNGMTFGTLAGMLAANWVLGRESPWQDLFAIDRMKVRGGAWDVVKENLDYPYFMVKDRVLPAEGTSTSEVKRGEGKILNLDGQRVACSRDAQGKVRLVSAVCTHLGCLVRWNGTERTWDCPCHGSRFHPDGAVLAGPAEAPLEKVKKPPAKASAQSKKPRPRASGSRSTRR